MIWGEGSHPWSSTAHELDSKGYYHTSPPHGPQVQPMSSSNSGGQHPSKVNTAKENPLAKLTLMGTRKKVLKVKSYITMPVVETHSVCKIHCPSFEDYIKHYHNLTSLKMEAYGKGGQLCGERRKLNFWW